MSNRAAGNASAGAWTKGGQGQGRHRSERKSLNEEVQETVEWAWDLERQARLLRESLVAQVREGEA